MSHLGRTRQPGQRHPTFSHRPAAAALPTRSADSRGRICRRPLTHLPGPSRPLLPPLHRRPTEPSLPTSANATAAAAGHPVALRFIHIPKNAGEAMRGNYWCRYDDRAPRSRERRRQGDRPCTVWARFFGRVRARSATVRAASGSGRPTQRGRLPARGECGAGGAGGGGGRDRAREFCSAHHIPPKYWPTTLEPSPYEGPGTVTVCGEAKGGTASPTCDPPIHHHRPPPSPLQHTTTTTSHHHHPPLSLGSLPLRQKH